MDYRVRPDSWRGVGYMVLVFEGAGFITRGQRLAYAVFHAAWSEGETILTENITTLDFAGKLYSIGWINLNNTRVMRNE